MANRFFFLARYYLRNLLTMRLIGRTFGLIALRNSESKWREIHDSVKENDTWLVVGNGPSLRLEDLEALKDIPAIASNKINLLFSKTSWRPRFYTIVDPILLYKLPAASYEDIELVMLPHTHRYMSRAERKLSWRHLLNPEGEETYLNTHTEVSPQNGFFCGGTVTNPNLQLAIWAGAKTIYLIGCDHFYANEQSKDSSKKGEHAGASNHFDPNYRKPGEVVNEAPVDVMNRGYAVMRQIADQRGVRIVNISRRTALDAFERDTVENALAAINGNKAQTVQA